MVPNRGPEQPVTNTFVAAVLAIMKAQRLDGFYAICIFEMGFTLYV
jgi:hypothetical protein